MSTGRDAWYCLMDWYWLLYGRGRARESSSYYGGIFTTGASPVRTNGPFLWYKRARYQYCLALSSHAVYPVRAILSTVLYRDAGDCV
eukprot:3448743-Rhodomonas_salina.1